VDRPVNGMVRESAMAAPLSLSVKRSVMVPPIMACAGAAANPAMLRKCRRYTTQQTDEG
jgi:hypothetical protein